MNELPESGPWRVAFDEAWMSWCTGNYGIGAALADSATGVVVSQGHNKVMTPAAEPGRLAGNFLAHAEMNALAGLPHKLARGFQLYTTLESCPMCAGAALMMHIDHMHYAGADELMSGVHELWVQQPFTASRLAPRTGPLGGLVEHFAQVLPLLFMATNIPDGIGASHARETTPDRWATVERLIETGALDDVRDRGGDVGEAVAVVAAAG